MLIGQVPKGVVVGQFPNSGEYFGTTSELGNPIVECVNLAIAALDVAGTLEALRSEWLADLDYQTLQ